MNQTIDDILDGLRERGNLREIPADGSSESLVAEMMKYNIMTTPAVVVDGTVRIKGHVPSEDEVKKALGI